MQQHNYDYLDLIDNGKNSLKDDSLTDESPIDNCSTFSTITGSQIKTRNRKLSSFQVAKGINEETKFRIQKNYKRQSFSKDRNEQEAEEIMLTTGLDLIQLRAWSLIYHQEVLQREETQQEYALRKMKKFVQAVGKNALFLGLFFDLNCHRQSYQVAILG